MIMKLKASRLHSVVLEMKNFLCSEIELCR